MEINEGELVGLIGPNGAGKTTLFNMLTGVYVPSEGSIEFTKDDKPIKLNGIKPYKITALGLARTFQNIRLFKDMTVLENVLIAMNKDVDYGVITALLRLPKYYKSEIAMKKKAMELLTIMDQIAEERNVSLAQIAEKWVIQKRFVSSCIIGAQSRARVEENCRNLQWELTDNEIRRLESVRIL